MKKKIVVPLVICLLALIGFYLFSSTHKTTNPQVTTNENPYFNNSEALFLRNQLNEYLKSPNSKTTNGISDYDSDYYTSPFIVYEENNSLAGGKQLEIIFVNKPDKMFTALVYKLSTGDYELKGFGQNTKVTTAGLQNIRTEYKKYFEDNKYFY